MQPREIKQLESSMVVFQPPDSRISVSLVWTAWNKFSARANKESRLMELFLFHFRQTGWTLEQVFLGVPAFGTVDPANMEAILSPNFKGLFLKTLVCPITVLKAKINSTRAKFN